MARSKGHWILPLLTSCLRHARQTVWRHGSSFGDLPLASSYSSKQIPHSAWSDMMLLLLKKNVFQKYTTSVIYSLSISLVFEVTNCSVLCILVESLEPSVVSASLVMCYISRTPLSRSENPRLAANQSQTRRNTRQFESTFSTNHFSSSFFVNFLDLFWANGRNV